MFLRFIISGLIIVSLTLFANAQTSGTYVKNRKEDRGGPFGTEWAKPSGTRGSYIYNDPRLPDPNRSYPSGRNLRCPAPMLFDPASGSCR